LAAGANGSSRFHEIIPYIDQRISLILMSKNLDELLPPLLQVDVALLVGKESQPPCMASNFAKRRQIR
jgi:hypothetical protein